MKKEIIVHLRTDIVPSTLTPEDLPTILPSLSSMEETETVVQDIQKGTIIVEIIVIEITVIMMVVIRDLVKIVTTATEDRRIVTIDRAIM